MDAFSACRSIIGDTMSTGTFTWVVCRRNSMSARSSCGGVNADMRISSGTCLAMTATATLADADTTTFASM